MPPTSPVITETGGPPFHTTHQPTILGEAPLFRASDNTLHWVDFQSSPPTLHILSTPSPQTPYSIFSLPETTTCLYFRANKPNSYIVGYESGIGFLTVDSSSSSSSSTTENAQNGDPRLHFEVVKELVEKSQKGKMTVNDGGVDPAGRFWVAAVDLEVLLGTGGPGKLPKKKGKGKLWRFDGEEVRVMEEGIVVGNGMAWSVDGKTMYLNDSGVQQTWAYDFDVATGDISNKRVLIDHSKLGFDNVAEIMNDGMVIDADSNLWIAQWAGSCVMAFSPSGTLIRRIDFNAKFITCPTWGGEDGNTLFITSGTDFRKASKAKEGDQGGNVFSWRGEGVRGVEKGIFRPGGGKALL